MRRNTKQYLIAEILNAGGSRREAYEMLRPMVENQQQPMVFAANVNGRRVAKPISRQLIELRYEINRVSQKLSGYSDADDFNPADSGDATPIETAEPVETAEPIEEPSEPEPIKARGKRKLEDAKRFFLSEVRRVREFCAIREMSGETIDAISMRPVEAGERLIPAGIPPEALLSAMVLHWPSEAKNSAGILDFDFLSLSAEIMADREISEIQRSNGKLEKPHALFGYALTLVENRQPVFAIGPAGTGKSHLAKQIADYLEMSYAECPMTPGATRGDLLGRHTVQGFIPAEFVNIYAGGGIFNFEEIDAADPSMLLVLNNALASDALYNPVNGEQYDKSETFAPWANGNTFGLGANRSFTGREKLDAATIDRWRMGRFIVNVDETVEASMLGL